jgi:O-antigen ligase
LKDNRSISIIDKLIFLFFIIFLLSLTNSIFINQVGYYGSLLLILYKYFISRRNPFERSGLELVFIWFILAELISAILSVNQELSLYHTLKRALLIPVVYVTLAGVNDFKTGKRFFWVYIGASLVTSIIYLYFAYDAYVQGVHGVEDAATSFFQYPITAGEIISFSVVFLFAFLINEKGSWKYKLFLLVALGIAAMSLVATYKRTGWVGTSFGIFIILLLKKEWRIITAGIVFFVVLILIQENVSKVFVYKYSNRKLIEEHRIETMGRATNVFPTDSGFVLSDYENGLVVYEDTSVVNKLSLPGPVGNYYKWKNDYFIADLIDTRFILLKKKSGRWNIEGEFISPGFTVRSIISNGKFYVLDSDSGLTVFNSPDNITDSLRYPGIKNYYTFYIDSAFALFYSSKQRVTIFDIVNGELQSKIYDSTLADNITQVYYDNSRFLISKDKMIKLYRINNNGLTIIDSSNVVHSIYQWQKNEGGLFALGSPASLYEMSIENDEIKILSKNSLDFFPQSLNYDGEKIYFTYVERSKLNSIWDPFMPSNTTRLSLWRVGWEIFKDYPIFGVGDIDMGEYQKKYRKYYEKEIHGHLHNNFVHVLATLGLFGFLAVCYMLVKMYIINFDIYKNRKNKNFISSYSLGAIGALSAFIVAGLTEQNIWDHEISTLVYFTFAFNIALNRHYNDEFNK